MRLIYLTTGKGPSRDLKKQFDSVIIVKVAPKNLHKKVSSVERKMEESGSHKFDINDFVLWTPELDALGEVIARKRLNAGMVHNEGKNGKISMIGDEPFYPQVFIGETPVSLTHVSQLPTNGKARNILFVCPHWEEETGLIGSYLHKRNGDNVHVLFVTDIPNGKTEAQTRVHHEKAHQVYRTVIGLTEEEYSFIGIPDERVLDHKRKFQSALESKIIKFKPDTVIMPPEGSNFDHNSTLRYSLPILEKHKVDLLLGEVVQDTKLRPSIFPVLDWNEVERFVEVYTDGDFGGAQYKLTVRNMFTKLPEGLNRFLGEIYARKGDEVKIGVFGLQPIRLKNGYKIPHATKVFDEKFRIHKP